MYIIGAGMAGLLAARMLPTSVAVVLESQSELPNNHHALLRFRGQQFSKAVHIDFRPVQVHKAIYYDGHFFNQSNPKLDNMYSLKTNGSIYQRSIMNLDTAERWIAPGDLIRQLAVGLNIQYNLAVENRNHLLELANGEPIISTIPLPTMLHLMGMEFVPEEFRHIGIHSYRTIIYSPEIDTYQTIYFPDPAIPFYRISITGDQLIAESNTHIVNTAEREGYLRELVFESFGVDIISHLSTSSHFQQYGKLLSMKNQQLRRSIIMELTDRWQIYSLGRFATWRQLLLDDLVKDVELIIQMIAGRRSYRTHYYQKGEPECK